MSNFRRCGACGEYGWFDNSKYLGNHVCAPVWEVRMHDLRCYGDEWSEIHANGADGAAAKFAELRDQNGDYDIIQAGGTEVDVRKPGEESFTVYDVTAESVPQYTAHKSSEHMHDPVSGAGESNG